MTEPERVTLRAYLDGASVEPDTVETIIACEVDDLVRRGESLVAPMVRHILSELRREVRFP